MRFSLRLIVLTLLVAALVAPVAQAAKVDFTFNGTRTSIDTAASSADENTSSWALTIDATSNVSTENVFGGRPRFSVGGAVAGTYRIFMTKRTFTKSYYKNTVNEGDRIFLRGKKDDSSTSEKSLNVYGVFLP